MPGINFNNSSWPHMAKALRIWSAVTMVTAPPVCLLPAFFSRLFPNAWLPFCLQMTAIALYLAGMFVPLYILNNKYGNQTPTAAYGTDTAKNKTADNRMNADEKNKPADRNRQIKRCIIFALVMLLLMLLIAFTSHTFGVTNTGIRMGYIQQYSLQEWSASYRLLDGTVSKTLYPVSGSSTYTIEVETTQGTLSIEMTDSAGNVIFYAKDMQPGSYGVTISDATRVKITGKEHVGSFSISIADE